MIADRGSFQAESEFKITNAAQLIGHYMILNGDDEEFVEFLVTHSLCLRFCCRRVKTPCISAAAVIVKTLPCVFHRLRS